MRGKKEEDIIGEIMVVILLVIGGIIWSAMKIEKLQKNNLKPS